MSLFKEKFGGLIFLVILLLTTGVFAQQTQTVVSERTLRMGRASPTVHNLSFVRTQAQLSSQYQYKLIIKNADGQPHIVVSAASCNSLSLLRRIICYADRLFQQTYVNAFRVDSASIVLNGVSVVNSTSFNKQTARLEIVLGGVALQNNIIVQLTGPRTSSVSFSVIATLNAVTDSQAPTIMASMTSNSLTNSNNLQITVNDASTVAVDVYKNGAVILNTDQKIFNLPLAEGANSFVIKARDQYNNQAADLVLDHIILDTTPPALTSNIKSKYYFSQLPGQAQIEVYSDEPLTELSVNSQPAMLDPTGNFYIYQLQATQTGAVTLQIQAKDQVKNVKQISVSTDFLVDNTPPVIVVNSATLFYTIGNSYLMPVEITDDTDTVTRLKIDQQYVGPFNEKNFSYLIEFTEDASKTVEITTTDEAGNVSVKSVQVVRNTQPLQAGILSPLGGASVNTQLVSLQISATKPIAKVIANNIEYVISNPQLSVSVQVQYFADASYTLPVTVTDVFGDTASDSVEFEIKSNSVLAWDYMQCRAE